MKNSAAELIAIIPSLLWFILASFIVYLFYRPIREELIPKLGSFELGGFKLSFAKESLESAIELAQKSPQWHVTITPEDKRRALNRAKKHLELFRGAQFLWVDDHPENNLNERRMFRQLGAEIDTARSTEEALAMLKEGGYDVVISDIARGGQEDAGLQFLQAFRDGNAATPVIFYVGVVLAARGVPAQAFGITNRPDELLHLALDALERTKY